MRVRYFNSKGVATAFPRGTVAGLGDVVRDDVLELAPGPTEVGKKFVRYLASAQSHWPSRGRTRNSGPWATNTSVRRFRAQQVRTGRGRFSNVALLNDARNRSGRPYAAFVDAGVRAGPQRRAANFRAVERTWDQYRIPPRRGRGR